MYFGTDDWNDVLASLEPLVELPCFEGDLYDVDGNTEEGKSMIRDFLKTNEKGFESLATGECGGDDPWDDSWDDSWDDDWDQVIYEDDSWDDYYYDYTGASSTFYVATALSTLTAAALLSV